MSQSPAAAGSKPRSRSRPNRRALVQWAPAGPGRRARPGAVVPAAPAQKIWENRQ